MGCLEPTFPVSTWLWRMTVGSGHMIKMRFSLLKPYLTAWTLLLTTAPHSLSRQFGRISTLRRYFLMGTCPLCCQHQGQRAPPTKTSLHGLVSKSMHSLQCNQETQNHLFIPSVCLFFVEWFEKCFPNDPNILLNALLLGHPFKSKKDLLYKNLVCAFLWSFWSERNRWNFKSNETKD